MEPAVYGVLAIGKKTVQWTVLRVGRTGGNPVSFTKNLKTVQLTYFLQRKSGEILLSSLFNNLITFSRSF